MRIAKIVGTVTLNREHSTLRGGTLKLAVPLSLANLSGQSDNDGETLVIYDELAAGMGSRILLSDGREAAQPFHPDVKPIDAYNAAILDTIQIEEES
jgi:ethanolamine utilization protein EutN